MSINRVSIRLPQDLHEELTKKLEAFKKAHPFKVTMTDLIVSTIRLGLNPPSYEPVPKPKGIPKPEKFSISTPSTTYNLIGTYISAWQKRYGTKARPDVGGKSQGILKRLSKSHSKENLSLLIQAYCQMNDDWFVKKVHDLSTFEQNINKVALALDKGRDNPTKKTWEDLLEEEERVLDDEGSLQLADS